MIFNINKCKLPVNEKYINNVCPILILWNGSTLICCLSVSASSISFFFTHCEKRNPNKIQIQNYNFSKIADLLNVKEIWIFLIVFFLIFARTCMPRLLKLIAIVSEGISRVQTPFLHPSLPTSEWGCGRWGGSAVTQETTTTARPV